MGYTTEFKGSFFFDQPLTKKQADYIRKFSETRRMTRNNTILNELFVGHNGHPSLEYPNNYGTQGEFFVGGGGFAGQERDASIMDYNQPPSSQPSLWCGWTVNEDGTALVWNGAEKFYEYEGWLRYMIDNFFVVWNVNLNGMMKWQGDERTDKGKIVVRDNQIQMFYPKNSERYWWV